MQRKKRGTRSQSETGNLLGPIWPRQGGKKIHSGQGFHLCRVKSGTMSAATSAKTLLPHPLLSVQTNPLFPPFIPFHPFLRALTKASEPFIISLVTSSTGENFLATQLRLVRLPPSCLASRAIFPFLSFSRGGGGFFQPPRCLIMRREIVSTRSKLTRNFSLHPL